MPKLNMSLSLSEYLQSTIDKELPNLRAISDAEASVSARNGWTRKQEVGHLIDSATNNHARFVQIALRDGFKGESYDQNGWVALHGYSEMPWSTIVDFWYSYNGIIAKLVANIPEQRLATVCEVGNSGPITLRFLIEDYVVHMQHHIDQALGRANATQYPQVRAASNK